MFQMFTFSSSKWLVGLPLPLSRGFRGRGPPQRAEGDVHEAGGRDRAHPQLRRHLLRGEREPLLPELGGRHEEDGLGQGEGWLLRRALEVNLASGV